MTGQNRRGGTEIQFFRCSKSEKIMVLTLKCQKIHYIDNYYLIEDLNAKGVVKIETV